MGKAVVFFAMGAGGYARIFPTQNFKALMDPVAPWAGQVIVNLEALYADPTFKGIFVLVRLARVRKPGHDLRTFECPRCQHVETAVVQFK